MTTQKIANSFKVHLKTDMATAEQKVTEALKTQGFGVLTEIDVQQTLKNKIDVDFRPYKILGACNPHFAHKALNETLDIGLLLPCNVTLTELDDGTIEVALINPHMMGSMVDAPGMEPIASEAEAALKKVVEILEEN